MILFFSFKYLSVNVLMLLWCCFTVVCPSTAHGSKCFLGGRSSPHINNNKLYFTVSRETLLSRALCDDRRGSVHFRSQHHDRHSTGISRSVFHLVYTIPTLIKFCRFKCISKTSIPWSTFAHPVLLLVSVTISLALQFDSVSRCRVTLLPPTQFQDTLQRCRRRRPQRGR